MTEYPSILRLLEAERERYTLEAAELSRRLEFVHNQMKSLDTLISGYAIEEQMYSTQRRLYNVDSTQAFLKDSLVEESESDSAVAESSLLTEAESNPPTLNQTIAQTSPVIPDSQSPINHIESTVSSTVEPDISDIPKLIIPRKPGNVSLLPQFQEYSVQNAVLILMRRRPDLHMHTDAVVRDLYGELSPQEFKKAKSNVGSALSAGSNLGLWYRVLGTNGVYTLHYEKGVTSSSRRK